MHTWTKVPFLARQIIAEEVGRAHQTRQRPNYPDLAAHYAEFLQHLISTADTSIFSFNYDDVILDALGAAGLSLEDGFRDDLFDPSRYLGSGSTLGFPHGHARFVLDLKGLRRYPSILEANAARFGNLHGGMEETRYLLDSPNSYSFNTFMVTGHDKDSSLNEKPFAAYYHRLAHDLLTSERVIVIGHSLQDSHVNRLLVNFLGLSEERRILIVDYQEKPVDVVAGFMNPSSPIHRLLQVMGVSGIPVDSPKLPFAYRFQDQVDRMNHTGIGMLYPQILYWTRGFEEFLSTFRSILEAEMCL